MSLRLVVLLISFFAVPLAFSADDLGLTDMLWAKDVWAKQQSCKRINGFENPYEYKNYIIEDITYSIASVPKPGFSSADDLDADYFNASHKLHVLFSTDISLPVFENYRSIAPSHKNALDTYYDVVMNGRKFADSRMQWLYQVEEDLPLNRVSVHQIRDITTGKLYGVIRVFDASPVVSVPLRPLKKDTNYLSPVERSLILRGTSTSAIEKIRKLYPKAKIFEFGKAHRDPSIYGLIAKASWELSVVDRAIVSEFDEGGFIFIHTDRAGAILYKRDYGADVVQAIKPTASGKLNVVDQTAAFREDPAGTEYILMVDTDTFSRTVLGRYTTDPDKSKLMENEYFRWMVQKKKDQLDNKLETRALLRRPVPGLRPDGTVDIDEYLKSQ